MTNTKTKNIDHKVNRTWLGNNRYIKNNSYTKKKYIYIFLLVKMYFLRYVPE